EANPPRVRHMLHPKMTAEPSIPKSKLDAFVPEHLRERLRWTAEHDAMARAIMREFGLQMPRDRELAHALAERSGCLVATLRSQRMLRLPCSRCSIFESQGGHPKKSRLIAVAARLQAKNLCGRIITPREKSFSPHVAPSEDLALTSCDPFRISNCLRCNEREPPFIHARSRQ